MDLLEPTSAHQKENIKIFMLDETDYKSLKRIFEANGDTVIQTEDFIPYDRSILHSRDHHKLKIMNDVRSVINNETSIVLINFFLRDEEGSMEKSFDYFDKRLLSVEVAQEIRSLYPNLKVVFMTRNDNKYGFLNSHFRGYSGVLKDDILIHKPNREHNVEGISFCCRVRDLALRK